MWRNLNSYASLSSLLRQLLLHGKMYFDPVMTEPATLSLSLNGLCCPPGSLARKDVTRWQRTGPQPLSWIALCKIVTLTGTSQSYPTATIGRQAWQTDPECLNGGWVGADYWIWVFISLQDETKSCYIDAGKRPLRKVQDGGRQYIVSGDMISQAMEKGVDIRVVVIYGMYSSVPMNQIWIQNIAFPNN